MNYEEIKVLAKQVKTPVTELIALPPNNDPFYLGAPAQRISAEWFGDIFNDFGITSNVHIRHIHYRMISQETSILIPNGKVLINPLKIARPILTTL